MGISVKKLLDYYFTVEDLKNALYDIGEPLSGNKDALINRITQTWKDHNRNLRDLLGYMPPDALDAFCQFYKIDDSGTDEAVIRRIVKSGIVESLEKYSIPSSPAANQPLPQPRREVTEQKPTAPEKPVPHPDMSPRNKRIIEIIGVVAGIATIISLVLIFYDRFFP